MTTLAGHLDTRCRCGRVVQLWPDGRWVRCPGCRRMWRLPVPTLTVGLTDRAQQLQRIVGKL